MPKHHNFKGCQTYTLSIEDWTWKLSDIVILKFLYYWRLLTIDNWQLILLHHHCLGDWPPVFELISVVCMAKCPLWMRRCKESTNFFECAVCGAFWHIPNIMWQTWSWTSFVFLSSVQNCFDVSAVTAKAHWSRRASSVDVKSMRSNSKQPSDEAIPPFQMDQSGASWNCRYVSTKRFFTIFFWPLTPSCATASQAARPKGAGWSLLAGKHCFAASFRTPVSAPASAKNFSRSSADIACHLFEHFFCSDLHSSGDTWLRSNHCRWKTFHPGSNVSWDTDNAMLIGQYNTRGPTSNIQPIRGLKGYYVHSIPANYTTGKPLALVNMTTTARGSLEIYSNFRSQIRKKAAPRT